MVEFLLNLVNKNYFNYKKSVIMKNEVFFNYCEIGIWEKIDARFHGHDKTNN
jgi:hypothetical protein